MVDHYSVLGLTDRATADEIKAAYFKLAKEHHPDANKNPGSAERFRLIAASYEVLKNDETRAQYLIEKNGVAMGEEWNRARRNNYNDVRGDFDRASEKMKANNRTAFKLMGMFESFIHPRTLFVLIPTGMFTYWVFSSAFKDNQGDVKGGQGGQMVAAWKNAKTNRWEEPAPWDPEYKKYIATTPLQQIDRSLVTSSFARR
jgi:DnaJ-class molecular chaperone